MQGAVASPPVQSAVIRHTAKGVRRGATKWVDEQHSILVKPYTNLSDSSIDVF